MAIRARTNRTGVYQLTAKCKQFRGKSDVCYYITYKVGKRKVWEKIGWRSDGYTVAMASHIRGERLRSLKHDGVLPSQYAPMTLEQAWQAYLRDHLSGKASEAMSLSIWTNHIRDILGGRSVSDISPHDISRLSKSIESKGLSVQTTVHTLALVRRILRKCLDWGLWGGPMPKITIPKPNNARYRFLSPDEARALLDALEARSRQVRVIAEISLRTGMRLDEILRLQGQHLDFSAGVINCCGKGGAWRQLRMGDRVADLLRERRPLPGQYVFLSADGGKINDLSKTYSRVADEMFNSGVTDRRARVVFHTLRHTYASWLAMDGVPLLAMAELLGHTSAKMTQRYAHLCPSTVRDAASRIDDIIGHHKS